MCKWGFALAIMVGWLPTLGADELNYRMPEYGPHEPPPPRDIAEVRLAIANNNADNDTNVPDEETLRVMLIAGPKDHGPGEHDYPAWQDVWKRLLAQAPYTKVSTAWRFPTPEEAAEADVMVFYQKGEWNEPRAQLIDAFLERGGGLVYIHWAVNGDERSHEFAKRIGLASHAGMIGYRHGALDIDFSPAANHPIARNIKRLRCYDETYWRLRGDPTSLRLLGTSQEENEPTPQFWTCERGKGRVFVSIPGHFMWTFDDPMYRLLLMRGIAWTGSRNVDRFNNLVLLDARVEETGPKSTDAPDQQ